MTSESTVSTLSVESAKEIIISPSPTRDQRDDLAFNLPSGSYECTIIAIEACPYSLHEDMDLGINSLYVTLLVKNGDYPVLLRVGFDLIPSEIMILKEFTGEIHPGIYWHRLIGCHGRVYLQHSINRRPDGTIQDSVKIRFLQNS